MNHGGKTSGSTQVESWYVATEKGAIEYGIDALKADVERGLVHEKSLVWRKGMQDWVELDQVPLLRMLVNVEAHPKIHSPAPASTAVFDELFEEKTTVFNRASVESAVAAAAPEPEAMLVVPVTPSDNASVAMAANADTASLAVADTALQQAGPAGNPSNVAADASSTAIFVGLFGEPARDPSSPQSEPPASAPQPEGFVNGPQVVRSRRPPKPRRSSGGKSQSKVTEPAPHRQPEASPSEGLRTTLTRAPTPRVSIPGVLAVPTEAKRIFQVPKQEPIAETLAPTTLSQVPERIAPTAVAATATGESHTVVPRTAVTTGSSEATSSPAVAARSPSRIDTHLPIPPPPPLRQPAVTTAPATPVAPPPAPKVPPTRTETRLPIPAPPPLSTTAIPVPIGPTVAMAHASVVPANEPPTPQEPPAAPAITGASQQAAAASPPASPISENKQPALKALTAFTQASVTATPRPTPPLHREMADAPAVAAAPVSAHEPSLEKDPLADSIYPSISSIQPGLRSTRLSKRTLVVSVGVTLTVAAAAIIVSTATPNEKVRDNSIERSEVTSGRKAQNSASAAAARPAPAVPTSSSAEVATNAAPMPKQPQQESSRPATATIPSAQSQASGVVRTASSAAASITRGKPTHASGAAPNGKRVARTTESSAPPASTDPVATWEQGPIEKRPWMAPGF